MIKALLVFIIIFQTSFGQNTLQYNLKIGDSLKINQVAEQDIIQDMDGSEHKITNILESDFSFIVSSKTDSSYIISFKFDSFKLKTTSNLYGELINVNTKDSIAEDDIEAKIFSGLTETFLEMELLRNGKITHVSGTGNMIKNMIDKANIADEFTRELMIESMKKEFGNESLSKSFEQMTFIYPDNDVKIGDTWKNTYDGKMQCENEWKLANLNDSINIDGKSNITMTVNEDSHNMNLKGTQETNIIANKESGFIESMHVKSHAEGITIMAQMKDTEIPTTITSTTTYKIYKNVQ